jgi:hypothetical protein
MSEHEWRAVVTAPQGGPVYAKPLEVRWLCHECHMTQHHESLREAA